MPAAGMAIRRGAAGGGTPGASLRCLHSRSGGRHSMVWRLCTGIAGHAICGTRSFASLESKLLAVLSP